VNRDRVAELFSQALELPESEREAYLETVENDTEVRSEVARLLGGHAEAGGFLEAPVSDQAAALVGSVPEPNHVGRTIGAYSVLRELGRGGMGVVYLAERAGDDFEQMVALKVIRGHLLSEDVLRRFRQERRILAGLQHPGIAMLLDGGVTDQGEPYFAMEFVDGDDVIAYCDRRELGVEDRLRLFLRICRTVQHAHVNLVVHRDLKPSNILVNADGATKLLDFGIAKLLDEDDTSTEPLTREGQRALTPEYAAPEQIRGEQITTATDVYALGVVLFKLLTGCGPYRVEGSGGQMVERAVCEFDPPAPSEAVTAEGGAIFRGMTPERLKRRLAGDLDTVVLKALRKEPERRYHSAEAMADDLQRHLDQLPVRARPDTMGYRASKFISRHRFVVVAVGALIVALAFGLAGTAWQARVAASERDRAEQEAARAEQVKDYVLSLFEASNPAESRGADITARELLSRGVERIDTELVDQPNLQAEMLEVIGSVNQSLGDYHQTEKLFERALALRRSVGGDPAATAIAIKRVAQAKHSLGEYDAAEALYRDALEIQKSELGEGHGDVGRTLNDLGVILVLQGKSADAEPLYRRSLRIQRREFGPNHLETLQTLSNIGSMYWEMGNYEAAEEINRESVALRRQMFGEDHPEVAAELSNLATTLSTQGKYEEAERLHRESLALWMKLLGDEHPSVASSLNNLAAVLRHQGNYAEAEPLCRRALAIDLKTLGDEHPYVAMDLDNLGVVLAEQGRLDEGYELLEQAQAMHRRVVGIDSPRTALSRSYQGVVRWYQGRDEEAELMLGEALESIRSNVGPKTPKAASILVSLAAIYAARGEAASARTTYAEALAIQRATLREGHPDLILSLVGAGESHMALDRCSDAEPVLREALELGESGLPDGHWRIALAQSSLGECLILMGHDDGRALMVSGYEGLRRVRGDWHPATRRAYERLSLVSQ